MGSTPQPAPLAPKDDSDRGDGTTTSDARLDVVLEALRENADRQAFLLRLSDALRPLADAHEIQATASRLLGEHLRANRVCYGETTDTEVIVRRDYVDGVPSMVGRYPKDSFGRVMTDRLRRGETLVVDDMDRLPGLLDSERQVTRAIHVAAHIAVTLIKDGQWVANLAVHSATPRHWTPAEVALAEDVADRTWAAAERARAEVALQQAHDALEERVQERTLALARANAALEEQVRERTAAESQIKALFRRLVSAQEDERRAIARDIHDHVGQQMTALRMSLEALHMRTVSGRPIADQLGRTQELASELDRSVDFLAWQLRPAALDEIGLSAGLNELVTAWAHRFHIEAAYGESDMDGVRLPAEVNTNVYRLVQEALHNIVKHARATRATVTLSRLNDRGVLVIEDNGAGFDPGTEGRPEDRRMGLVGMRERALLIGGEFEIQSSPGRGTALFLRFPVH